MATTPTNPDPSLRLQALTQEYARFSHSAGGLSAMAGGLACLLSYVAGATLPASTGLRIALIAIPLLWLLGKEWLARGYYQSLGRVDELVATRDRRYHLFFAGFTALVSALIAFKVLSVVAPFGEKPWDGRVAGYLAVVVLLPWIVWRWLRTPLEFIVGVFLLCQAALAFTGRTYGFTLGTAMFPIAAVALVAAGFRDHRRFQKLQAELRELVATRHVAE